MLVRTAITALVCALFISPGAMPAEPLTYRSAVVALIDDMAIRIAFEEGLAGKGRGHDYDAVTTYGFLSDVQDAHAADFIAALRARDIQLVLMLRPTSVGPGASLDSVRDEVPPETLASMRAFAREVSVSGPDDLIVVVHMAIYLVDEHDTRLVTAGAVWLDESVDDQAQGMELLQDLIVANVDAVRPRIRQYLGLPPLE